MLGDERLELADNLCVASEPHLGVDVLDLVRQALLAEAAEVVTPGPSRATSASGGPRQSANARPRSSIESATGAVRASSTSRSNSRRSSERGSTISR